MESALVDESDKPDKYSLWQSYRYLPASDVREKLIECYMPFAKSVAATLYGLRIDFGLAFDDYLQYARVGLIEAIDHYDPQRQAMFETYAVHRIRGAVLTGITRETELGAQHEYRRLLVRDRAQSLLLKEAKPDGVALEDFFDLTVGLALGALLDLDKVDVIDEAVPANPYASKEFSELKETIYSLVKTLPQNEREVITAHYFDHSDFRLIADTMHLTKGRISQLHAQALRRIRQSLTQKPRLDKKL